TAVSGKEEKTEESPRLGVDRSIHISRVVSVLANPRNAREQRAPKGAMEVPDSPSPFQGS
ncbi:MAG: hypothetical protein NTU94_18595, partial [Planctomycetota bacterium]|nr:hypothetical protein [Planctomycetota bacterium]